MVEILSSNLPILSGVAKAKAALAIPASSAKSERVFSVSGNFVTTKRHSLDSDWVKDLVMISSNLKMLEEFDEMKNL